MLVFATVVLISSLNISVLCSRANPLNTQFKNGIVPIIWEYNTGEVCMQVDISDDGRYAVVGTKHTTYFFERTSSTPVWTFNSPATQVGISGDGRYIVTQARPYIYLFEKSSNSSLWAATYPIAGDSVAISRDGKYISASRFVGEEVVSLFSRSTNEPIWTAHLYGGDIDFTTLSENGEYLVAGDDSGRAYLFQRTSSTPIWIFKASDKIKNVCISRDGNYLAAGCEDHNVYFFSRGSNVPLWNFTTKGFFYSNRFGISMSNDGSYIAVASGYGGYGPQPGDKNIYLFHKTSNTPVWRYETSHEAGSVSISGDGERLIAGNVGGQVYFFDKASSVPLWSYSIADVVDLPMGTTVAISNDGNYAIAGTEIGKIFLFGPLRTPGDSITLPPWSQWWFWTIIALGTTSSVFAFTTIRCYRKKTHIQKEQGVTPAKPVSKKEFKVCPNCGAKLPVDSAFCGKCGTPLK